MNIYIEANFVLELALLQEQHASCEEILRLCERRRGTLVVPAYSLVEPYETLVRRRSARKRLKEETDIEFEQLRRTADYAQRLEEFKRITGLLTDSGDDEMKRLESVRARLLRVGQIIPLPRSILRAATRHPAARVLSPQDGIVYASVLSHLAKASQGESCFLNRNAKDFNDPDLVRELKELNCKILFRFDHGLAYIRERLGGE